MLLDSNIIIYSALPQHKSLREFIARESPYISAVSYVEVLGYHRLSEQDRAFFDSFFAVAKPLPLDGPVLTEAVRLRQLRKMTLGDALIAATALAYGLTLITHNTNDFAWIPGLALFDPLDAPS